MISEKSKAIESDKDTIKEQELLKQSNKNLLPVCEIDQEESKFSSSHVLLRSQPVKEIKDLVEKQENNNIDCNFNFELNPDKNPAA
jgi:hypothetical protein